MFYKLTKKLFHGTYQYKVVLVCPGAGVFRNNDLDEVLLGLQKIESTLTTNKESLYLRRYSIKTREELDYALQLQSLLLKLTDFDIRVESPWISIYTNNSKDIDKIVKLNPDNVKYISAPPDNGALTENTIILPKVDYDYRVTIGKTVQSHDAFIQWAETNAKLKLTKSCKKELTKPRSWGGSYFYLTGDKNLLLAKMHLGGSISKIERIIKA